MAARIEPLLTVADLDSCPDDNNRYELIDGELFVSRAPGIPHQRVLLNLEVALSNYLSAHRAGILVPGAGAIFSNYDAVIPDLVFVRNERWSEVVSNNKFTAGLDLVIEILSPGKENRDRDLWSSGNCTQSTALRNIGSLIARIGRSKSTDQARHSLKAS